ncbi:MAG: LemA family protein [Phycisphaerae bacterium]|nr:LemA family protein [Phycisphaerae bacterium]
MTRLVLGLSLSAGWIVLAIIVVLLLMVLFIYNNLVRLRMQVKNAWSQIDVQLKRRYDLIPNLVETVKGYATHEKETFERVIQARQQAISSRGVKEQAQAENMHTGALRQLFALSEAYPDLKANQNFLQLQEELTGTENKISFSRQYYNNVVQNYNTAIQVFPAVIFAGMFGFTKEDFFELENVQERSVPKVQF